MQRKILATAFLALFAIFTFNVAKAENTPAIASCGGELLTAGVPYPLSQDTTGKLCVNATVSATVGGFQPNGTYTSLTATATSSASTALAGLGTTVRLTNLGAGTVSCTFATGAATGLVNNTEIGPSSSVSRVIGSFDHIACIDQTGSSGSQLVILEGGSGLGNDTGGGGGGGSSGAVFGPTAVGSANANPPVVIGGTVTGAAGQNVEGVAVKPASTAPLATDFALVTVESPNSPVVSALNTASLCQGLSSEQTAVTTANPQKIMCDLIGKLVTSPYANRENMVRGSNSTTGTGATAFTGISAPGASLKVYLTSVNCGRTDAGTTAISVTLNDTASTPIVIPANGGGGGNNKSFPVPLVLAANTAPTFTASAGVTTLFCDAQGFTGY